MHPFVVRPRDGLLIKDARGFNVAGGTASHSLLWPQPPTLAGAVRASFGRSLNYEEGRHSNSDWAALLRDIQVMGPLAVRRRGMADDWQPLFPAPADALRVGDEAVVWLVPGEPRTSIIVRAHWGDKKETDAIEALLRGRAPHKAKPLSMPRWWTGEQFVSWLTDPSAAIGGDFPHAPEVRMNVHLAIDAQSQSAEEGMLFSTETVELLRCRTPPSPPNPSAGQEEIAILGRTNKEISRNDWWPFGGKGKLARVEKPPRDPFDPPRAIEAWPTSRFVRFVLLTPGHFAEGWRPVWLKAQDKTFRGRWQGIDWTLRAAFISRPDWCSGWDLKDWQPKPSRRLVPPGSVYYLEAAREVTARDFEMLWLASLQDEHSQELRDGFGYVVPGCWPQDTTKET